MNTRQNISAPTTGPRKHVLQVFLLLLVLLSSPMAFAIGELDVVNDPAGESAYRPVDILCGLL